MIVTATAEYIAGQWREIGRVMGAEWNDERSDDLQVVVTETGSAPIVSFVWDAGTTLQYAVTLVSTDHVQETTRDGESMLDVVWRRMASDADRVRVSSGRGFVPHPR